MKNENIEAAIASLPGFPNPLAININLMSTSSSFANLSSI